MIHATELERRAERSPDQTTALLVAELIGQAWQNEDAETAIDMYRTANWIID